MVVWNKHRKNIKIINNAIDTTQFLYDSHKSIAKKKELGIEKKWVVGHVGNFVPRKKPCISHYKFFTNSKNLRKIVVLILVGGGNSKTHQAKAKELGLEKNVYFLGVRSDVKDILQAMDIFLFPSTNEGLPVTLIEAQASGLKILASDEIY